MPSLRVTNFCVSSLIAQQEKFTNPHSKYAQHMWKEFLCPFAVYYLRYAFTSFFTLSHISLADGKRAGQKVQRKIAAAVQNVKTPLLFVPLF
jgi:hypothetical protein